MVPLREIREPREEPEGRPGGPGREKRAREDPLLAVLRSHGHHMAGQLLLHPGGRGGGYLGTIRSLEAL